jgi:hypothetical protein
MILPEGRNHRVIENPQRLRDCIGRNSRAISPCSFPDFGRLILFYRYFPIHEGERMTRLETEHYVPDITMIKPRRSTNNIVTSTFHRIHPMTGSIANPLKARGGKRGDWLIRFPFMRFIRKLSRGARVSSDLVNPVGVRQRVSHPGSFRFGKPTRIANVRIINYRHGNRAEDIRCASSDLTIRRSITDK